MVVQDHHRVLGLPRTANIEAVRTAYKAKVLECHPDRPTGNAEVFKAVQAAYAALMKAKSQPVLRPTGVPRTSAAAARCKPVPSVVKPRMAVKAMLSDLRTCVVFDGHMDSISLGALQHGDVVQLSNGDKGCIIGVAGDGELYWWFDGSPHASSLGKPRASLRFQVVGKAKAAAGQAPTNRANPPQTGGTPRPTPPVSVHFDAAKMANQTPAACAIVTTAQLAALETQRRTEFYRAIGIFWEQCHWTANLPTYAPHDRVYNKQGSPLYR